MKSPATHVVFDNKRGGVIARFKSEGAAQRAVARIADDNMASPGDGRFIARPVTEADGPDTGMNKLSHYLSFNTITFDNHGRYIAGSYFDVPREEYGVGYLTGVRLAGELLQYIKGSACRECGFLHHIEEATKALADREGINGFGRRGAAVGFLRTLERMLHFAAKYCDHQADVQFSLKRSEEMRVAVEKRRAAAGAVFTKKMQEARAKKAAARAQPKRSAKAPAARASSALVEEAVHA